MKIKASSIHDVPNELLTHIFFFLHSTSDLYQCQLVSHTWHVASNPSLYESIYIGRRHAEQRLAVLHTMGNYVKHVQFERPDYVVQVLSLCPNLIKVNTMRPQQREFWSALKKFPQLKLQSIPRAGHNLTDYTEVAIQFRNTLKEVSVCDAVAYKTEDVQANMFDLMASNLNKFTKLQDLKIIKHTNQLLSDLDDLIDSCESLVSLSITLYPSRDVTRPSKALPNIRARLGIKFFKGHWELMQNDLAIHYLTQKLPFLNTLQLGSTLHRLSPTAVTSDAMHTFITYLFKIPYVKVECPFNQLNTLWTTYLVGNTTAAQTVQMGLNYTEESPNIMAFSSRPGNQSVTLSYSTSSAELPHKTLIEKAGQQLTKLEISNIGKIQRNLLDLDSMVSGQWLVHLLSHCPNLTYLAIDTPGQLSFHNLQSHHKLNSLSISHVYSEIGATVLPQLSANLPSLTELELFFYGDRKEVTLIDMPQTHFDVLLWSKRSVYLLKDHTSWQVHVKVSTHTGVYYFEGDKKTMQKSICEVYQNALQDYQCFDIRCASIKDFWIKYKDEFVDTKYPLLLK